MTKNQPNRLRIKELSESDRPREKMLRFGKSSLSDAELLAILIGSGNKDESALELSQRILSHFDNRLNELEQTKIDYLTHEFQGIGEAKAITILAALELSKRCNYRNDEKLQIKCSKDIFDLMKVHLYGLNNEESWVIYLNKGNRILRKIKISEGSADKTLIDIKKIMSGAINLFAPALIMVHNHPSGNITPSKADNELTTKLSGACKLFDIHFLDHVIFGNNNYYSYADNGSLF